MANHSNRFKRRDVLDVNEFVVPAEDLAAYEAHCKEFRDELQPQGPAEERLVRIIGDTTWRLRRVMVLETELLTQAMEEARPSIHVADPERANALALAKGYVKQARALDAIGKYEDRLHRLHDLALAEVRRRKMLGRTPLPAKRTIPGFEIDDGITPPGRVN